MISKNKRKLIQNLSKKKIRDKEGLFLIEGVKMVDELLQSSFNIKTLIATPEYIASQNTSNIPEVITATHEEIREVSLLKNAQQALAICQIPTYKFDWEDAKDDLIIALDSIQDPGNLGTIIRLADWFGIREVVCSNETVDVFNPKVIQATMGAIYRVNVTYQDLPDFLQEATNMKLPTYGAFLEGDDIYKQDLSPQGVIVMGNEGNGISKEVEACITQKIFIPSYPKGIPTSESLNVSMATSIICSEFRRRIF